MLVKKWRLVYSVLIILCVTPFWSMAQGIDEKINDALLPISVRALNFVLYAIPVGGGHRIPIILILLVLGA